MKHDGRCQAGRQQRARVQALAEFAAGCDVTGYYLPCHLHDLRRELKAHGVTLDHTRYLDAFLMFKMLRPGSTNHKSGTACRALLVPERI